jgi:ankyrin repeat protein
MYNNDGYGPLEWAAESGDVNCVEYCIRRGLNPYHINTVTGETLLHLSVKSYRLDVVKYLLDIGCDHTVKDKYGIDIMMLPSVKQDLELHNIIMNFIKTKKCKICQTPNKSNNKNAVGDGIHAQLTYYTDSNNVKKSHAIYKVNESNFLHFLIYSFLTFGIFLLAIVTTFWIWIPLIGAFCGGLL